MVVTHRVYYGPSHYNYPVRFLENEFQFQGMEAMNMHLCIEELLLLVILEHNKYINVVPDSNTYCNEVLKVLNI